MVDIIVEKGYPLPKGRDKNNVKILNFYQFNYAKLYDN